MKKVIISLFVLLISAMSATVHAETVGTVLSTDIGTVIDGAACKTYNVAGSTFVAAEDLRGYGFDVEWDESSRLLTITQNPYAQRTLLTAEDVNIEKSDCTIGEPLMDILATDIKVFVAGKEVEGYNIDGYMVIPVRALEPYAYVEYDDEKRLVKIKGLQHYLDTRYAEGNPNIVQEVKEYLQPVHYWTKTLGGGLATNKEYDVEVKEVITTDNEGGKIYSYYGNPLTYFYPTPLDHMEACYEREIYSVSGANGEWLYEADLLYRNDTGFRYIITGTYAQNIYKADENLYGYKVTKENDHINAWPADEEINVPDMRFEKLTENGVVAQNGYFYKIQNAEDEERHFARYNIADEISSSYYDYLLSRNNVLYNASGYYSYGDEFDTNSRASQKASSAFDKVIEYDVKKIIDTDSSSLCFLKTNGELYYNNDIIASGVTDVVKYLNGYNSETAFCVLTNGGEIYIGDNFDFLNGEQIKIAENIKKIFGDESNSGGMRSTSVRYATLSNELYEYSVFGNSHEKIADNISEVVGSGLYITTEGVLTDLRKEYATEVKDAREKRDTIYIIKTDGTLWYYKNDELARVKAFE